MALGCPGVTPILWNSQHHLIINPTRLRGQAGHVSVLVFPWKFIIDTIYYAQHYIECWQFTNQRIIILIIV